MPAPTAWVDTARQRARHRLTAVRRGWSPPPFTAGPELGEATAPVVTLRQEPSIQSGMRLGPTSANGTRTNSAWPPS